MPDEAFDLGEDLLDRIEVRAVRRQVEQVHARVFEAFLDARHLVSRQIVDDDDAVWPHFRDQAFLKPLPEDHPGHGAREQLRGQDAVMRQARDEGGCHPVTVRSLGEQLLTLWAPAMAARHRRVRAGLIDKHQRCEVELGLSRPPERACKRDVGAILLSREDRFF